MNTPRVGRRWWMVGMVFCASAAATRGGETTSSQTTTLASIEPLAAVTHAAAERDLALSGIALAPGSGAAPRAGDAVTALVVLREPKRERQWLTHFEIATATEKELSGGTQIWTMGATGDAANGREHKFSAKATTPVEILTLGPFVRGREVAPAEKRARTLISPDFLALGIDRYCAASLKIDALQRERAARGAQAPADAREALSLLSEEDERALFGLLPALLAFLQGVEATPGLRDIMWSMIEKPSVWSLVKSGGKVSFGINAKDAESLETPDWLPQEMPFYRFPFTLHLNDKPALRCVLFVTSPRPPLLTTAGIVGISARPPERDDRQLEIRIIAAQPALARETGKTVRAETESAK